MAAGWIALWILIIVLMALQAGGAILQIKNYEKAVARSRRMGITGVGQRRGKFLNSYIVIVSCDKDHVVQHVEILDGITLASRFREIKEVLGEPIEGKTFEYFLQKLRALDDKERKRQEGYLNAFASLEGYFEKQKHKEQEAAEEARRAALQQEQAEERIYDDLDDEDEGMEPADD